MRRWLEGDLAGLDPRSEGEVLRQLVVQACEEEQPLHLLWEALAHADLLALAELATGARAVAHPLAVEASLAWTQQLEQVITPSGLYSRLIDLAPGLGPAILQHAASRHPGARWMARLSRRFDPVPGRLHLLAVSPADLQQAVTACADEGLVAGLVAVSGELGTLRPALALLSRGRVEAAQEAAAAALDADPELPVVPWLAAVWGPQPGPLLAGVARHLSSPEARARLRGECRGMPEVQEVLK